ncbi:MAG: polysaccharide biosynthesis protein [Nitriliruptoraceae bacterium]|nr:polysaccharide biosynthesis protein [Nitriliruptoraceae bacterium]
MSRSGALRPPASGSWWSRLASQSIRGPVDLAVLVLDTVLITFAFAFMLVLRYELSVPDGAWGGYWRFIGIAIVVLLIANRAAGLYGPVWQHASIIEAQRILFAGIGATGVLVAWQLLAERQVPLSVVFTGGLGATFLMGVLRFQSRLFAHNRRQRVDDTRVLVVGAGHSAVALLREIDRAPEQGFNVVAMVDDDPRKIGRSLGAIPIAGSIGELEEVGEAYAAELVILAIPSADSPLVRRVADAVTALEVPLKVLPSVAEMVNGEAKLQDVRDLSIDDLLGRQPIAPALASAASLLRGRRVLVTGGGGSIGSEIVRQVAEYAPEKLIVLDRDETNLFDAMAGIQGRGTPVLLDVRDRDRLRRLFLRERPEIVFHAAANKHVPLLEAHPGEAAATNVLGTRNLVAAAREVGVERFVFVSTDKAVDPANVMGASKRIGERLVLSDVPEGAAWCAVRFGNVLGSRGSVVPTFMRQIREGGPVTLTHPDMTRFFMSIPEAVQLVLQAAALADDRQIFMLEMGEPVRILDLATRMISLAGMRPGVDIPIEVTGLRPGEKLTEELHTTDEVPSSTEHPKIFRLSTDAGAPQVLRTLIKDVVDALGRFDEEAIRELLLPRTLAAANGAAAPPQGSDEGQPVDRTQDASAAASDVSGTVRVHGSPSGRGEITTGGRRPS